MVVLTNLARTKRYSLVAMLLVSLILLTGARWYFNPKSDSLPLSVVAPTPESHLPAATPTATATPAADQAPISDDPTFAPYLHIVPGTGGDTIFISAAGPQVGGAVVASVSIGGSHHNGGTMTYSDTVKAYIVEAFPGFTPGQNQEGNLFITTTLGLSTGAVDLNRAYIPASTTQTISSVDGMLKLTTVSTDTFPSEAYVVVVPSIAPPGPPPSGHRLAGSVYSVRASGAIVVADRPMSLRLSYTSTTLAGADPHTLAIFAWDANPANPHWDNLGGTLFSTQQYLSVATSRFTTYALMATPTWRDDFDEFSGLDFSQFNNVTIGGTPGNRTLILANAPGTGSAISQPISPTTTFLGWDRLNFTGIVMPPTTSLTVDILSAADSPVLTNVSSGADLAGLDPAQYPALRLRVNLASTAGGQTPALAEWQLSWQLEEEPKTYLPAVLK